MGDVANRPEQGLLRLALEARQRIALCVRKEECIVPNAELSWRHLKERNR